MNPGCAVQGGINILRHRALAKVSKYRCLNTRDKMQPSEVLVSLLIVKPKKYYLLHIFLETLEMEQCHQQLLCRG